MNASERAVDVNTRVDLTLGTSLRWRILLNDKILTPLQELFRPIPEPIIQKLVSLAGQIPQMKLFAGAGPVVGRQHNEGLESISNIVHIFSYTGSDTPTVQRFYESLLPFYGDSYNFSKNDPTNRMYRSPINVENLGFAIARLGENGKQFIPWVQQKLEEEQRALQNAQEESIRISEWQLKQVKKTVERYLYILNALQGKPPGKYRFSMKNWLQKLACHQQSSFEPTG